MALHHNAFQQLTDLIGIILVVTRPTNGTQDVLYYEAFDLVFS